MGHPVRITGDTSGFTAALPLGTAFKSPIPARQPARRPAPARGTSSITTRL